MPPIRSITVGDSLTLEDFKGIVYTFTEKHIPVGVKTEQDLEDYLHKTWIPSVTRTYSLYTELSAKEVQDKTDAAAAIGIVYTPEVIAGKPVAFDTAVDEADLQVKQDELAAQTKPVVRLITHDHYQMVVHVFSVSPLSLTVFVGNLDVSVPPKWWVDDEAAVTVDPAVVIP